MRRTLSALCLSTALGLTAALPAHAAETPLTPTAPTVVDECGLGRDRVTIPDIAGLQYLVDIGGMSVRLTPGAYAGIAFIPWDEEGLEQEDLFPEDGDLVLPDARATITVEALDDYTLADGAITSFDVALSSTPCTPSTSPVTATQECGTVTFSNPAGNPEAIVYWGDEDADEPEELRVPAGSQRSVHPDAGHIVWVATDAGLDVTGWSAEGASTPDAVATEQDRRDLIEAAELLDLLLAPPLGTGDLRVEDCTTDSGDDDAETVAPPATPVIPAVVQTDGVGTDASPGAPALLGGLTALTALVLLRPRRRA